MKHKKILWLAHTIPLFAFSYQGTTLCFLVTYNCTSNQLETNSVVPSCEAKMVSVRCTLISHFFDMILA